MNTPLHRQLAHKALLKLRTTSARKPILKTMVKLHNSSYHWISFFSSHQGKHPKHDILNYHQFFIDNIKPTDTVLDLGSGTGEATYDIAKHATHVIGIDNDKPRITKARKNYSADNLEYIFGDITTTQFEKSVDVAMLSNVLEHIEHRVELLKSVSKIAPKILIRVPMITRDWVTVFKKNEGLEYRLDHTHYIEFTEENFREEIILAGLTVSSLQTKFGEIYAVCEVPKQ